MNIERLTGRIREIVGDMSPSHRAEIMRDLEKWAGREAADQEHTNEWEGVPDTDVPRPVPSFQDKLARQRGRIVTS